MEEKKGSKKKKGTGKKIVVGFLGVGLIIGLTIAGTLAFLNATSETKTNTFTASADIVLGLEEPNYNVKTENGIEVVDDLSKPNPLDYQPETTYDKDPTLYNLTGDATVEEWVALRVDYGISNGTNVQGVTYGQLTQDGSQGGYNGKGGIINTISFDTDWIQLTKEQIKSLGGTAMNNVNAEDIKYDIFIYKYKIKAKEGLTTVNDTNESNFEKTTCADGTITVGNKTSPLFSSITVKNKQQLINNGYVDSGLLKAQTFKIILQGAAAKNDSTVDVNFKEINANQLTTTGTDSYEIATSLVSLLSGKTVNFN